MAQDLVKIKKKKELPPIVKRPSDPLALYRSKADQVKKNLAEKLARKKGEEAYAKAMKESEAPESDEKSKTEIAIAQQNQLIKTLTATGKELEAVLADTAPGEQRPVKMQIGKNAKQIERVEEKLEELKSL